MNWIHKIQVYVEQHREWFNVILGSGIGFLTGLSHWWEHFTQPENLDKFYDGCFSTAVHTLIGAVVLWALRKYILKTKKDDSDQ